MLFSLAAVAALLAMIAPRVGAADDPDELPPPEVFTGFAAARGVSVDIHPPDLLPVSVLFKFTALDGASTFQTTNKTASASILFPGNGALSGPSLLCGTFLAPSVPPEFKPILDLCLKYKYPLTVNADEFEPDASTTGSLALGDPKSDISGEAVLARAHAGDDGARSDAVINNLGLLGLPPFGALSLPLQKLKLDGSVVKVETASARTDQRIVKGGLVTKATTVLSGISVLGGLVEIGSINSSSAVTDDAEGEQTADANITVTGVTVAGIPAQITSKGLVLGPGNKTTPLQLALVDSVNKLLTNLGIRITLLNTNETANKGDFAAASAGGVLVEYSRVVQGLPPLPSPIAPGQQLDANGKYSVTIELGATGVRGQASNFGSDDETDVGGASDDLGGDFGGGDFGLGGDFGTGGNGNDFPTITNPRPGNNNGDGSLVSNVIDTFGDRLGLVYLALVLSVLGLCIAPRLAVPARFPGPK